MATKKKKELTYDVDGYHTIWRYAEDDKSVVEVDVYKNDILIMEWSYGKVRSTLLDNMNFWINQAVCQAKSLEEQRKKEGNKYDY